MQTLSQENRLKISQPLCPQAGQRLLRNYSLRTWLNKLMAQRQRPRKRHWHGAFQQAFGAAFPCCYALAESPMTARFRQLESHLRHLHMQRRQRNDECGVEMFTRAERYLQRLLRTPEGMEIVALYLQLTA